MMNKIWKTKSVGIKTKVKLHISNVRSVFCMNAKLETWTWGWGERILRNLECFKTNACLRRMMRMFWPMYPKRFINENWSRIFEWSDHKKKIYVHGTSGERRE